MRLFLIIWSLSLITASAGSGLNSSLTKIVESSLNENNKMAECFEHIFQLRDPRFVENIAIRLKAESIVTRREFMDTIERIYAIREMVPIQLNGVESTSYYIRIRIYFIDSLYSLQFIVNQQRERDSDSLAVRQKYLIVLPKDIRNSEPMMAQIFEYCWNHSIVNVNVALEDSEGVITLYTYYPFNERSCTDRTPIVHNRFKNGSFLYKKPTFPIKMKNFWKCPVRYIYWDQQKDFTKTHENVLAILSDAMNFTLKYVHSPDQLGTIDLKGKAFTGAFKMLNENRGDIVNSICQWKPPRFFASAGPHRYINIVLIVRWPEAFSPLEILFFPFDIYTWFALFMFFVGKAIGRLVWKRISSNQTPQGNFILQLHIIPWLFSMMILRSCYEGSVFRFLNQRPRRSPPKNIDEAIQRDFKFIVHPNIYEQLVASNELKDKLVIIEDSFVATLDMFDKSERHYALIDLEDSLELFSSHRERRWNYFVGRDYIQFYLECYYLSKYSYLAEELKIRLGQLHIHGHLNNIFQTSTSVKDFQKNFKETHKGEQAKLNQLMGTFQLLVVLLGVSVCIFILELFTRSNRRVRIIMDLLH